MSKTLRSIGLMSGTSLDGIDVALLETDGENQVKRGPSMTIPYSEQKAALLREALLESAVLTDRKQRPGLLGGTENLLTGWHSDAVDIFLKEKNIKANEVDVIGFHGQTVLHKPELGLTVQLGSGQKLANRTGISVVYDMRAADVAAGGQGAPLVPIYHAALALTRPCAFVNIGGVGNVTFIGSGGELLAFDTGPGNAPINDWMMKHKGLAFDEGGKASLSGKISQHHLHTALSLPYFQRKPPKSLDRNSFTGLNFNDLSFADGAATLAAFTTHSIAASAKWASEQPKQWVICGGGRHNAAIMQGLSAILPNVISSDAIGLNGDTMEAEAWAYLAVRSFKGLPLSFPSTTGVKTALTGGIIARPTE